MKYSWLLFMCGVLIIGNTKAQTGKYLNSEYYSNFIPKNPQSSALGSFGNTPINYYTGLPEVSIPIMNLKGRDIDVPISLNYDATGVRTDEISGPVGLKWNLNAGGFIAREMNGLPDEHPTLGYWKFSSETDYYQNMDKPTWADYSQRNERDCQYDEFVINLNGRNIKFVFNKYKQAVPVPRQNVNIKWTLSSNKIYQFEVTTEDGMKYIFGGNVNAVEERKIETLNIGFAFDYDEQTTPLGTKLYTVGSEKYSSQITTTEKVIDFFNSKWYLVSMIAPTGETTSFTYSKNGTLVYATRPSMVRVRPLIESKTYTLTENLTVVNLINVGAVRKYAPTNPGSSCNNLGPWAYPPGCPSIGTFDDRDYRATPGSGNGYHSLVTESNIKLVSITASTGSRVEFTSSSRTDLPGAVKYDFIKLYNFNNTLVKSIKLNFANVSASDPDNTDYFWLSEAILFKSISPLQTSEENYYAYHAKQYPETAVSNLLLRKYVFEGLKDSNYKRLFLESVEDDTGNGLISNPIRLYEFSYKDRNLLKRRTTVLHDAYGYQRTNSTSVGNVVIEVGSPGKKAIICNAYSLERTSNRFPQSGLLNKIKYSTGGYTRFTYSNANSATFKLQVVEDVDENETVTNSSEIEYLSYETDFTPNEIEHYKSNVTGSPIFVSYEDFNIWDTNDWMKYEISSTSPQNGSFTLTQGVPEGNDIIKVYKGTKSVNSGYELFDYYSSVDLNNKDVTVAVTSQPAETNVDGSSINNTIFPFTRNRERDYLRGYLSKHQVFRNGFATPISETLYTYSTNPYGYVAPAIFGFNGGSFNYATHSHIDFWKGFEADVETRYRYARYGVVADWVVLDNVKATAFDQTDLTKKQTKVTTYKYDPTYLQVVETKTYNEDFPTETITNKTKYVTHSDYFYPKSCNTAYNTCVSGCADDPLCLSQCYDQLNTCLNSTGTTETAAIIQLKKNNQTSTPIEQQTLIEQNGATRLISSVAYKYQKFGTGQFVKPTEVWGFKRSLQISEYSESNVNSSGVFIVDDSKMRKLHTFNSYDVTYGNVLQQTSLDGTVSNYQWDATKSLVTGFIVNTGASQHSYGYTHTPLIGVSTVTDPNSIVSTFEYDELKRLKLVKDQNNKILSRYRYHFITQPDEFPTDFTISGDPYVGSAITFNTGALSTGAGYSSNQYRWQYGDGTENTGGSASASRVYTAPGTYNVYVHMSNPERNPVSVVKQVTIHPQLTASICADGPVKFEKCTGSVFQYGSCASPVNNTPSSPTLLKVTAGGGCPTTAYTYSWEFQRVTSCGTDPWVSLGTGTQVTAPPGFINRTMDGCGNVDYNIRVIVTDQCGKTVTSSTLQLSVFKNGCA